MRELDEYIIANECSRSYILTPEQIACRKETLAEIMEVLNACTEQQRQRKLPPKNKRARARKRAAIFPFNSRNALYLFTAFYKPSWSAGVKWASNHILKPLKQKRAKPHKRSVHAALRRYMKQNLLLRLTGYSTIFYRLRFIMSGLSSALSRILLRTAVYPFPRDFAF